MSTKSNTCSECKSKVERPIILMTQCHGPEMCLQNEPGNHTHIDSVCPFCGHVFQSLVERGRSKWQK